MRSLLGLCVPGVTEGSKRPLKRPLPSCDRENSQSIRKLVVYQNSDIKFFIAVGKEILYHRPHSLTKQSIILFFEKINGGTMRKRYVLTNGNKDCISKLQKATTDLISLQHDEEKKLTKKYYGVLCCVKI